MLDRRDLTVNSTYQRGTELWPGGPRSYFIDTILSRYPFPKIYFYEMFDPKSGRIRREVVDGQQRISAIRGFYKDEFSLSEEHARGGLKFSGIDQDAQRQFMQYVVAVDVIRDATHAEIVEMFRRMNAYTLPLNEAEKRHAAFQGPFKWTMLRLADSCGEFFSQFGVFTNRQMVRMADQELLAETYAFTKQGVFSSSPKLLRNLYKSGDVEFVDGSAFALQVDEAVKFVAQRFPLLRQTFMMKPYAFYTLLCALIFNRYGIEAGALGLEDRRESQGAFAGNPHHAETRLLALASAHESKETAGLYQEYVTGCAGGTNRSIQRTLRLKHVLAALQS
ncbi:MAG: DUF262 domain-containing protein [Planctomycetota bacterium]|nr:DUF262 domain-containing protein [Planctomycetota bacterium]